MNLYFTLQYVMTFIHAVVSAVQSQLNPQIKFDRKTFIVIYSDCQFILFTLPTTYLITYLTDFLPFILGLGHEHFWISGTDLADEGHFFWMANGRPITFTNWNAGEPNNFRYENGEEENCLELWNRDGKGLKWNDSPCSFETYFVCEVQ